MLKLIKRFAATPFSGYLSIGLIVAAAGAGYWFWTELKEFGGLEQKSVDQANKIRELELDVSYMEGQNDLKQQIGTLLSQTEQRIDRRYEAMQRDFQEALKDAPQEYIDCRNMVVPERLRYQDGNQAGQN